MKDTYYFSHDYTARTDPKIKRLLARHGISGYGIFWAIIEDLYNNANALPLDYDSIAFDLRTEKIIIESVINDFELFVIDGETFGSLSVERRLNERNAKSLKARKSAISRWEKYKSNANVMQTQCDGNAIKERKGNEKKINKTIFIKPTLEEIKNYCLERKNNVDPDKFFNFYESNGWMVGKNKMKNWKAAIVTWEKNNFETNKEPLKNWA